MKNADINRKVAEEVMGWTIQWDYPLHYVEKRDGEYWKVTDTTFNPCEDISDAWKVVEKLKEKYNVHIIEWFFTEGTQVELTKDGKSIVCIEEIGTPMAICLSALKIKGEWFGNLTGRLKILNEIV